MTHTASILLSALTILGPAAFAQEAASHQPSPVTTRSFGAMGTDVTIEIEGLEKAAAEAAIDAAVAEIERIENLMTDWRPSPLTRLNDASGRGPQEVPLELAAIIARSVEVSRRSGGAFDPTFASVGVLWNFKNREAPTLPDEDAIEAARKLVDAQRVAIDPKASTVDLPAGFRIGLGGIAKGYGVDRAMETLREHGVEHASVNAGGDLKVLGRRDGSPWEIAIKHPRRREHAIAVLRVSNTCVVTSGDYERFITIDGQRYHHILDPRTGYPSTGCISATVVGPNAELADALATAVCVLGPDEGLALLRSMDRYDGILIGADETVHATERLAPALRGPTTKPSSGR